MTRMVGCAFAALSVNPSWQALDAFLKASRLEPNNPKIYELLLSAVSEAKTAAGIGNPDVGDDRGGDQDPGGGAGAVGAGVLEEAKGEGAAPTVFGTGHGTGQGDAGGVDGAYGSVVEPLEHGVEEAHPASSHSTLGVRGESVVDGGNVRYDQHSDEDATVPGVVQGARGGHDQRGTEATGGGGGGGMGMREVGMGMREVMGSMIQSWTLMLEARCRTRATILPRLKSTRKGVEQIPFQPRHLREQ